MLTCHKNICIPPEGPFATMLFPRYSELTDWNSENKAAFLDDVLAVEKMENWKLDSPSIRREFIGRACENFGQAVSGIYDLYRSRTDPEATRWGDKSGTVPLHSLAGVCEQLGEFRMIHIVRDGRDVLCSYRGTKGISHKYAPNLSTNPVVVGREWNQRVLALDTLIEKLGREKSLCVRYEDLVSHPQENLERICQFLGEAFDERMTRFGEENARKELEPQSFLQWKSKTTEPPTNSRVGRWKKELTRQETAEFEMAATEGLRRFGYALSNGKPGPGLRFRVFCSEMKYQLGRVLRRLKG